MPKVQTPPLRRRTLQHEVTRPEIQAIRKLQSIELKQLHYAVAAADEGSLRRAAETLFVRQSTLSRSIRQLEQTVEAEIFQRSSGGVTLTPAGRRVIRVARTIVAELDALFATSKMSRAGAVGRLAVGLCTSLSTGNLRATLMNFRERFPQIEIATTEKSQGLLATYLRNGTLDVLITTGDVSDHAGRRLHLWSERILLTLPKDHPLTEREAVSWTDLRNETILLSQHDPIRELEELLVAKLASPMERPRVERHDVSRGIIKSLVAIRLGLSLVLESDLGVSFGTLAYREIRDGTGPSRVGFSAHWQEDNTNPALDRFLKLLAERYPSPATCD